MMLSEINKDNDTRYKKFVDNYINEHGDCHILSVELGEFIKQKGFGRKTYNELLDALGGNFIKRQKEVDENYKRLDFLASVFEDVVCDTHKVDLDIEIEVDEFHLCYTNNLSSNEHSYYLGEIDDSYELLYFSFAKTIKEIIKDNFKA